VTQDTSQLNAADLNNGRFFSGRKQILEAVGITFVCKGFSAFFDNHTNRNMLLQAYNRCAMALESSHVPTLLHTYREIARSVLARSVLGLEWIKWHWGGNVVKGC
jgi:hypothetical protein